MNLAKLGVISALLLMILFNALYLLVNVDSNSMFPTLKEGEVLLLKRVDPKSDDTLHRGDMVLFNTPHKDNVLKRLIGLQGDMVVYQNKTLFLGKNVKGKIDDYVKINQEYTGTQKATDDSYPAQIYRNVIDGVSFNIALVDIIPSNEGNFYRQEGMPVGQWEVPTGYVFVMGDNRDESMDSRYIGFIEKKSIRAKMR